MPSLTRSAFDSAQARAAFASQDRSLLRAMLHKVRLFREWPTEHIAAIVAATRVLHVAPGHLLVTQGQALNGIYVIAVGSVEVASMHVDGRLFVRRYAGPGMLFGLISVLDGEGSPYSYTAQGPTTVLLIPKDTFLDVLSRHPEMWASVARFVARFQRIALSTIDEHMFVTPQVRLARTLLSLVSGQGNQRGALMISITQDSLAGLLGVSRQTVSKELKELERGGRIRVSYGKIELLDYRAIERFALLGPT